MNRIIGVCTALIQSEINREFLGNLHNKAKSLKDKLIVFNSTSDFKFRKYEGAETVYDFIPFENLDALILMHDTVRNQDILEKIKQKADEAGLPLIMVRDDSFAEYSIMGHYESACEEMFRHIIEYHKVRDIFFISGCEDMNSKPNSDSTKRFRVLKKICDEYNIPLNDENIACGSYWEYPTKRIIDRYIESKRKLPDAFVCANDIMAAAVCSELLRFGIKVPQDVLVTGFDGMQCSRYSEPSLTTCFEDLEILSNLIFEMIDQIENDRIIKKKWDYDYKVRISESCGCNKCVSDRKIDTPQMLYNTIMVNDGDEEVANKWVEDLVDVDSLTGLMKNLHNYIQPNALLILRDDEAYLEMENLGDKYIELPDELLLFSNNDTNLEGKKVLLRQLWDKIDAYIDADSIAVITSVFTKNLTHGFYIEKIENTAIEGYMSHRHVRTLNNAIASVLSLERERVLKKHIEKSRVADSLTGLVNMRGLYHWFRDFSSHPENHNNYVEICAFSFINHDQIVDAFGIDVCDECVSFIAKNLELCHQRAIKISRISTSNFIVVLSEESEDVRRDIVYRGVDAFYKYISYHNEQDKNGPQIEVSSGSVDLNPGWDGSINEYINWACVEIYKNRSAMYEGRDDNEKLDLASERKAIGFLNTIVRNNQFTYYYQPIVDAYSGDIIAYEALMRTNGEIKLSPLEILDIAKRHRRLSDIETATFTNVLADFKARQEEFKYRLVFINTIPGYFLKDEEAKSLCEEYGELFKRVVVEITENGTADDEELLKIRRFGSDENQVRIAIDDYGSGHSNIVNLLKYDPKVIKIDRYLITDIHKDKNKQLFVGNIISLAKENSTMVLAEGVETKEELYEVIKLGVDLIQGYYTAMPKPEILDSLPQDIREDIHDANRYRG